MPEPDSARNLTRRFRSGDWFLCAGLPAAYAADLVGHMAGRPATRCTAPRRHLPRADLPAAMTARQPD